MSLKGRYFSPRDIRFVNSINRELVNDVLQIEVTVFKIHAGNTPTNIYGEIPSNSPKVYYPGVKLTCIANKQEMSTDVDDFGPDRKQEIAFCFLELALKKANFFPQVGDLIYYFQQYYTIDNVVRDQFLGGIAEKSFSFICHSHYTRLSSVDIVIRQT